MKISSVFASWKNWFVGWWNPEGRHQVLDVLNHVSAFADHAMPIVEAIDVQLKPALRTGNFAFSLTLEDFITKNCEGVDSKEIASLVSRVYGLPTPDLLVNVALFMLARVAPNHTGVSVLRLAIELAYNVYKVSKNETKVS